jgi:hypothetical protein
MGFALVRLGWRPDDFWTATPHELWSAIEVLEEQAKDAKKR